MPEQLTDREIVEIVRWPRDLRDPASIRTVLASVRRFIGYDEVLVDALGRPRALEEIQTFLAEEPFIIQTWNSGPAIHFFEVRFPELPQPLLVIKPPHFDMVTDGRRIRGKDFTRLGLADAEIYDRRPVSELRIPPTAYIAVFI